MDRIKIDVTKKKDSNGFAYGELELNLSQEKESKYNHKPGDGCYFDDIDIHLKEKQ